METSDSQRAERAGSTSTTTTTDGATPISPFTPPTARPTPPDGTGPATPTTPADPATPADPPTTSASAPATPPTPSTPPTRSAPKPPPTEPTAPPAPAREPEPGREPKARPDSASVAATALRIGQLAERTGVSVRLLRYYEQQGLLQPHRLGNGYRVFAEDDVRLVRYTRALLAAGLSTAVIGRLLPSVCERDGVLRPCTPELADELRRERDRINSQIDELLTSRRLLEEVIDAAPTHTP
ncbi:MerR family transcriptional regulator [Streptomyces sp. NPDC057702]|uniref:MerR family transcriptional regulator n=1 Tax=unclassified Streptomyces TaxID=2593676 RepID=UPI0036ABE998